jgi:hypothetical protein
MIEEVGSKPGNLTGFDLAAQFYDRKTQSRLTIGHLLSDLPTNQSLWDDRSALHFVTVLAHLPFPLRIYWSSADTVVGNQATEQSGKLYKGIKAANPASKVVEVTGTWPHSTEFVPTGKLGEALAAFGLISV